jgi:hypothetical protein
MAKYNYEYLEDNGGGLHLIVTDKNNKVVAGITNLEYAQPGEWNDVKNGLNENALNEVAGWDGSMEDQNINPAEFYADTSGLDTVCYNSKLFVDNMGRAAQIYFGIERE